MLRVVALLLLVTVPGCSFALVKGPPRTVALGEPVACTRSYAIPVLDGSVAVIGLLGVVSALSGLVPGVDGDSDEEALLLVAGGAAAVALGYAVAGARGARKVDRCRAASSTTRRSGSRSPFASAGR